MKENIERLDNQHKYIKGESYEDDFGDYLRLIAIVVSSFSLGVSIAIWVIKNS